MMTAEDLSRELARLNVKRLNIFSPVEKWHDQEVTRSKRGKWEVTAFIDNGKVLKSKPCGSLIEALCDCLGVEELLV